MGALLVETDCDYVAIRNTIGRLFISRPAAEIALGESRYVEVVGLGLTWSQPGDVQMRDLMRECPYELIKAKTDKLRIDAPLAALSFVDAFGFCGGLPLAYPVAPDASEVEYF